MGLSWDGPNPMFIVSESGNPIHINEAASQVLRYSEAEILTMSFAEFTLTPDIERPT